MTALHEIRGVLGAVRLSRPMLEIVVVAAAIVGLAFSTGGFFPQAWTVTAVGLFWLVALALLLGEEFELGRLDRVWLSLLVALIGWTALSLSWSSNASISLLEVRRGLVYVAALAALLLFSSPQSAFRVVAAVWASSGVVVVYALLRYLLRADSRVDPFQAALLSRPLGYANALGILAGVGAVLAVGLTAAAPSPRLRLLAAASVSPFAAAVYLTGSRGSALAIGVGLAVMFLLDRDRPRIVGVSCVLVPGAVVAVVLADRSRLVDEATGGAVASRAGYLLALSIAVVGVATAFASLWAGRIAAWIATRRFSGRALVTTALASVVAAVVFFGPGWRAHFTNEGYRPAYWHVAWIEYGAHPWLGSGAGTFGGYWLHYGTPGLAGGALDAHNLYLETLAELGPVGLVLLGAMLVLPLAVAARVRHRPLVPIALGAYSALLAHSALDWDWEMPAVMLAGLFCAAAIVACAREPAPAGRLSRRARTGAFAVACLLALFALLAQIL